MRCVLAVRGGERGSVLPLFAIVMLASVLAVTLIGVTARHYRRVARVQWAADAAALAIAAEGLDQSGLSSGRLVAEANGARLVAVSSAPPAPGTGDAFLSVVVVVEVEAAGITARAAATRVPG